MQIILDSEKDARLIEAVMLAMAPAPAPANAVGMPPAPEAPPAPPPSDWPLQGSAPPVPEQSNAELDSANEPWDPKKHSKTMAKTADGKWRTRRNSGAAAAAPEAPPAPPAPEAPPAPPAPEASPTQIFAQCIERLMERLKPPHNWTMVQVNELIVKHGGQNPASLRKLPDSCKAILAELDAPV